MIIALELPFDTSPRSGFLVSDCASTPAGRRKKKKCNLLPRPSVNLSGAQHKNRWRLLLWVHASARRRYL